MTRIGTNVASLRGLRSLNKASNLLNTSLTRLSTGLKINSGKDNPSGLIASETLRSQTSAIEQSIKNSNRANNVLSTADSALGEIGGLLTQVRGLVQEGLNSGALSQNEIEANQQQIDAALSAINRISANTNFAGEKLIDGSKGFVTKVSTADAAKFSDFKVNEAVLGSAKSIDLNASVDKVAEKASLVYKGRDLKASSTIEVGGAKGNEVVFLGGSASTTDIKNAVNSVTDTTGVSARIVNGSSLQSATNLTIGGEQTYVKLSQAGADLAAGGDLNIELVNSASGSTGTTATLRDDGNGAHTIVVELADDGAGGITGSTVDDVLAALGTVKDANGKSIASGSLANGATGTTDIAAAAGPLAVTSGTLRIDDNRGPNATGSLSISFGDPGAADQTLSVTTGSGGSNAITINLATDANGIVTSTLDEIVTALGSSTELLADGKTTVGSAIKAYTEGTSSGLASAQTTATLNEANGSTIKLESVGYGSAETVSLNVLSGKFDTTGDDYTSESRRDAGTDIAVTINGQAAYGRGLSASVRNNTLDAQVNFNAANNTKGESAKISVTGGGSLFQIGQEVSPAGQIGIGIEAVNTARLGGITGKLYELGTGAGKSLLDIRAGNASGADTVAIIEQSLNRVSTLRGRIGSVQKNVIETNISTLGVALENISDARSQITDTDFAEETASLTKAQILNQSGISVLAIANQAPSQVLSLLG